MHSETREGPSERSRRLPNIQARIRRLRIEESRGRRRRLPTMDPKYLGETERGWHSPTISTAKRIADALDATLAELIREL